MSHWTEDEEANVLYIEVFNAFDKIIRSGYRARGIHDERHLPTPDAALRAFAKRVHDVAASPPAPRQQEPEG